MNAEKYTLAEKANGKEANHADLHGHLYPIEKTPCANAPLTSKETTIEKISEHFKEIMLLHGLDLNDDSLKETPNRVARMYVNEIFSGLNPQNKPRITLFENAYRYNQMLIEKNITVFSYCEHHFVPIVGKAHVAYISNGKIIGLSKINRLVAFYARRPQLQERLTNQIAEGLKEVLGTGDVAVVMEATHFCVASRGVKDTNSSTLTTHYGGVFAREDKKAEFLSLIQNRL